MITSRKIVKHCFWLVMAFYINSCTPSLEGFSYLKNSGIQDTLDLTVASIFESEPYPDFVTIYFTESKGKEYIFVTPHKSIENVKSKYYFGENKKQIIVGYKTEKMEKRFANTKSSKPEKAFNYTNDMMDIYDGGQVVFKILSNDSIQEIEPTEEILELNNYGLIEFIPPVKN
jgi:hypothetical protein